MGLDGRLRELERALGADGRDALSWLRLSSAYEQAGARGPAIAAAARALRLAPPEATEPRLRLAALGFGHGPWPSPRGDARNTQRSPLPGPTEGVQRWRLELPRQPVGRPLVDGDGGVVIRTEPAGLLRVDPDGRRVDDLGDWPADVPPVLREGRPVALDADVLTLRGPERGGAFAWRVFEVVAGPDGGLFGLGAGSVVSLAPDRAVRWRVAVPAPAELAVPDSGPVYVALAEPELRLDSGFDRPGRVVALDRDTGAPLWALDQGRALCGDGQLAVVVADDGTVVAQVGMDLLCAAPDGALRWRRKLEWAAPPSLADGAIVTGSPAEGLVALDLATGDERWVRRDVRTTQPIAVDGRGHAFALGADARLAAVRPDGSLRWSLPLRGAGPLSGLAIGYDETAYLTVGRELVAVH